MSINHNHNNIQENLYLLVGFISWAVLYQAREVWEIYVSRIVGGVGGGIIFTAVPLYVGEIAEVNKHQ